MSTTRFIFTDQLRREAPTFKNGTGGAPSRTEDAAFPMENAYDRDRYVVWETGATPPDPVNYDLTYGSDRGYSWAAVANRRVAAADGSGGLTGFELNAQDGAYTPGGAWTALHSPVDVGSTAAAAKRNAFISFANDSWRSLRWRLFAPTNGRYSVKLWTGGNADIIDTGVIGGPGYTESLVIPSTDILTPEGATHRFIHGSVRRRFAMPFPVVKGDPASGSTLIAKLRQAVTSSQSFLLLTHNDEIYEVIVAPESAEQLLLAATTADALRGMTLFLEEQP